MTSCVYSVDIQFGGTFASTTQKKPPTMRKSTMMIMLASCMPPSYGSHTRRIRSFATAFLMPHHHRHSSTRVTAAKNANSWTTSSMMIHQQCSIGMVSSTRSIFTSHASSSSSSLYTTTPESNNELLVSSSNTDSKHVVNEEWNVDNSHNNIMIDPYSEQAFIDLANFYTHHNIDNRAGAIDVRLAYNKLLRLTESVVIWNERLNLISRVDCTPTVVYHRHVLPSVALLPLILNEINTHQNPNTNIDESSNDNNNYISNADNTPTFNIIDVGTGGGFPGLPLALLLPSVQFTLVDSIKKKLVAVSDMASELDVTNVRVHHGRVEEMYINEGTGQTTEHAGKYNIVLGRSVTALPRFCGWVTNLIKRETRHQEGGGGGGGGRLIYIIGGELDEIVSSRIVQDVPIDELLCRSKVMSDKRALIFDAQDVYEIARNSGEEVIRNDVVVVRNNSSSRSPPPARRKRVEQSSNTTGGGATGKSKPLAKGAWSKKQNDVKKQRGYDDFKRYES